MSSVSTADLIVETDDLPPVEEVETNLGDMSSTSPKVAYQPVTTDGSERLEMDPGRERAYRRSLGKTVNIVAFIIVCLVVAAVISVIIILVSPRNEDSMFEFETVAANLTLRLDVGIYPDNATIGGDLEDAFTALINGSIFRELFVEAVVLNIVRGSTVKVTLLIVLTDIGDHLGSPTGTSEKPTDVLDLVHASLAADNIKGFHIASYHISQSQS